MTNRPVTWARSDGVNFNHHGEPESGDARTMDDGSVWAHIAGPDPRGDDDRWVPLLDSAGVEAAGVSEVRSHDVTMSVAAGDAPMFPDDVKERLPGPISSWTCTRAACTTERRPGRSYSTISSARGVP